MLSWQVPYLAKDHRPDCNNSLGGDSNSGHILALGAYSNLTQIPRPFHFCVRLSYICSSLLLMLSWQVPYLAKGHRPEFNNSPGGYSNNGRVLAPRRLFESDSNNGHFNFVSNGVTAVQVSYLCFPGRCHFWPRFTGLTSIMAQEVTQIMAAFWSHGGQE